MLRDTGDEICDAVRLERTTQIGSASPTMPAPSEAKSDGLTHPGRGTLKRQIAANIEKSVKQYRRKPSKSWRNSRSRYLRTDDIGTASICFHLQAECASGRASWVRFHNRRWTWGLQAGFGAVLEPA